MATNPEELRKHWMAHGLPRHTLDPDPIKQFECWYGEAIDSGIAEPNAMSLATVDANAQPWLRTVLLKLYDETGFVFFTNYESTKAQQIAVNNRVGLLFPWVVLGRQVKISGTAEKIPAVESMKYFASRPRGSQIGAWASPQSQVISSRSLLDAKVDAPGEIYPCPPSGVVTACDRFRSSSGRPAIVDCMTALCIRKMMAAGASSDMRHS